MKKIQLMETFANNTIVSFNDGTNLCESGNSSLIDGQYIIGMVEGQFFKPDGMSRNNRWYSRQLWENVLDSADVKNRLLNHTMFGEIGHSDGPVTDNTLRGGEASHIVTDLWIDEKGRGMGRAYILNTETGKRLKTYLGANARLKVSTRGEGVYLEGEDHNGYPVIDPDSYELQTVDFVLNPGFLETNATLTAQKESVEETQISKISETTEQSTASKKEEGEQRMELSLNDYVAEMKEELKALKAENKSLNEQLRASEQKLLLKQYEESAEIKKINEEYKPFKDLKVSAKSLNETLKRSQSALTLERKKTAKLTEELQAFKKKCGSIKQVDEAASVLSRALGKISEYQKLGSVEQLKSLVEQSERMIPKLREIQTRDRSLLKEYKKLGSVDDVRKLGESCAKAIAGIRKLRQYEALGTVQDIKQVGLKAQKLISRLKEAQELGKKVEKLLPQLHEMKQLRDYAKRANRIIESYMKTVGSLKKARALQESKKATNRVNIKEAMTFARKFGTTVESAAKLLNKYGNVRATKLLESKINSTKLSGKKLADGKKLVEEVAQLDKVNAKPETKTAADFLKTGMITNAFNIDALGKEVEYKSFDNLDGEEIKGADKAKQLLKKYTDRLAAAQVEKEPKVEAPNTAAEAEKEAQKLLK